MEPCASFELKSLPALYTCPHQGVCKVCWRTAAATVGVDTAVRRSEVCLCVCCCFFSSEINSFSCLRSTEAYWTSSVLKCCGMSGLPEICNHNDHQWTLSRTLSWTVIVYTRVGTLIVATIYLQLIQNRYMFRSFTVLQCSHQHCVQPVASDVEVVGYL